MNPSITWRRSSSLTTCNIKISKFKLVRKIPPPKNCTLQKRARIASSYLIPSCQNLGLPKMRNGACYTKIGEGEVGMEHEILWRRRCVERGIALRPSWRPSCSNFEKWCCRRLQIADLSTVELRDVSSHSENLQLAKCRTWRKVHASTELNHCAFRFFVQLRIEWRRGGRALESRYRAAVLGCCLPVTVHCFCWIFQILESVPENWTRHLTHLEYFASLKCCKCFFFILLTIWKRF